MSEVVFTLCSPVLKANTQFEGAAGQLDEIGFGYSKQSIDRQYGGYGRLTNPDSTNLFRLYQGNGELSPNQT